jgi:hypothetical protein
MQTEALCFLFTLLVLHLFSTLIKKLTTVGEGALKESNRKSPNLAVKRDCGTGVVAPVSLVRAAAPYLQR